VVVVRGSVVVEIATDVVSAAAVVTSGTDEVTVLPAPFPPLQPDTMTTATAPTR
jgi:hypothetical protein